MPPNHLKCLCEPNTKVALCFEHVVTTADGIILKGVFVTPSVKCKPIINRIPSFGDYLPIA